MSLHFVVVHVESIRVRLWFCIAWIACDVVGGCSGPAARLVSVASSVRLSQVGHAARVGILIFSVAATSPAPVGVVTRDAVLHAGLACVGGAVIENLCAVAALGWGDYKGWSRNFSLGHELRLGL